jgi:hypothetical protein
MPQISLVGDDHGGSEDYGTIAAWWAVESLVDYGGLIEAQLKGDCGTGANISGSSVNGAVAYTIGVTYNGTNHASLAIIRAITHNTPSLDLRDVRFRINNIFDIAGLVTGNSSGGSTIERFFIDTPFTNGSTQLLRVDGPTPTLTIKQGVLDGDGITRGIQHRFDDSANIQNMVIINCDTGALGAGSNSNMTDSFATSNTTDYSLVATLTTCASGDATGTAGLQSLTTSELVNVSAGDYQTKTTSTLATAGTNTAYVGAFLQSGGGGTDTSITAESGSYLVTGTDAPVLLSSIVQALSGTYSVSGTDLAFKATFNLIPVSGSYLVSATETPLQHSASVVAESGSYLLTGTNVNLFANCAIIAQSGAYTLLGTSVTLVWSSDVPSELAAVKVKTNFSPNDPNTLFKANSLTINF